jgi:hypothetical protein
MEGKIRVAVSRGLGILFVTVTVIGKYYYLISIYKKFLSQSFQSIFERVPPN